MPRLSDLNLDDYFHVCELQAMVKSAELRALASSFALSDMVVTQAHKALVVLPDSHHLFVVSGQSALWVWGMSQEPFVHEISLRTRRRANHFYLEARRVRDLHLKPVQYDFVGKVATLSPIFALAEIARDVTKSDQEVADILRFAWRVIPESKVALARYLKTESRVPHTLRALRVLSNT